MRLYVFGDIHGQYSKLKSVLKQIEITEEDYVIFLGDLIDRGTENWNVLTTVYNLSQKFPGHIYVLRGNHEDMLLTYLSKYSLEAPINTRDIYVYNGGKSTLEELKIHYNVTPKLVNDIIDWIKTFPMHLIANKMHFSHAGCNPNIKSDEHQDYIWVREEFLNGYNGDELWFCGHTPIQMLDEFVPDVEIDMSDIKPFRLRNIMLMDTGSYFTNGKVSCYEVVNNKIYQSGII